MSSTVDRQRPDAEDSQPPVSPSSGSSHALPPDSDLGPEGDTVLSKRSNFPESLPAVVHDDSLVGRRLGDFELLALVGRGSMGAVYRARNVVLQRDVAVKVFASSGSDEFSARIRQEAQSAAQLQHENIPQVHQFGRTDEYCYLAMEFVEGRNMREIVAESGPISAAEAYAAAVQLASALEHVADRGVVHRDVKPSNVIRTSGGRVKLVDLGLARYGERDEEGDLTESGMTLGTFDYVSPEQARDPRLADIRSDLYSLGCTLFFVLTGRPPFPEGTPLQKLLQHQGDAPPDVRQFRPDLPEAFAAVIDRLLAKSVDHRYQHPSALSNDLARMRDHATLQLAFGDGAMAKPDRRLWLFPLALAAAAFVLLTRPGQSPPELQPPPSIYEPPSRGPSETFAEAVDSDSSSERSTTTESVASQGTSSWPPRTAAAPLPGVSETASRTAEAPSPSPDRNVIVVADGTVPEGRSFASLSAALAAAVDGDVIELRFDGVRSMDPVVLPGKRSDSGPPVRITLRVAAGRRPVLAFRPGELAVLPSNGVPLRRALFSLQGVQVTMHGVDLELEIPPDRGMPQNWSLFRCVGENTLRLNRCTVTIRRTANQLEPDRSEAAVIDAAAPAGFMASTRAARASIELQDCVVRSDGAFLRLEDHAGVDVVWRNGFFATSERFINATQRPHEGGGRADVELRRVTLSLGAGFYRGYAARSVASAFGPTQVRASDCIFRMASDQPFVEILEDDEGTPVTDSFQWRPDQTNYFSGVRMALLRWRGGQPQTYRFSDWNLIYGDAAYTKLLSEIDWEHPPPSVPASRMTPEMYRLNRSLPGNQAVAGAADGGDAGFRLQDLPTLPAGL